MKKCSARWIGFGFLVVMSLVQHVMRPDFDVIEASSNSALLADQHPPVNVTFNSVLPVAGQVASSFQTSSTSQVAYERTEAETKTDGAHLRNEYLTTATETATIRTTQASAKAATTTTTTPLSSQLKLPTPVIVLSLPKSGTTSVYHFFHRNGIPTSHYCCRPGAGDHPPCSPPEMYKIRTKENREARRFHSCGNCIHRNLQNNVAPLQDCGDDYFQVYAQMDVDKKINKKDTVFLPQIVALDQIHEHYPNATFILGTRDPQKWVRSVRNWFNLARRFSNLDLPEYDYQAGELKLTMFYRKHTRRVREFVRKHPSHRLVEIKIEDKASGSILGEAFGLNGSAWGRSNARLDL